MDQATTTEIPLTRMVQELPQPALEEHQVSETTILLQIPTVQATRTPPQIHMALQAIPDQIATAPRTLALDTVTLIPQTLTAPATTTRPPTHTALQDVTMTHRPRTTPLLVNF